MAVAFVNSNSAISQASGNPLTGAQTATAGSNCIIVDVYWNDVNEGIDISTVTYNGVAMTALGARVQMHTLQNFLRSYQLVAPATGSNTLTVTFSNANATTQAAVLRGYSGVDQTTPIRAGSYTSFGGLTDVNGQKALVVSSATDDRTVTAVVGNDVLPTTNQTGRNGQSILGTIFIACDDAVGAATVTHTWDVGGQFGIAMTGASLAAAGAAAGQPAGRRIATSTAGLSPWAVRRM